MKTEKLEALIDEALNAACLVIQQRMGQTDGGIAGVYFSGETHKAFVDLFKGYIELEESMTEKDAEGAPQNAAMDLPPGTRIRTEDGYVFTVQDDGSLTDGDMTFDSIQNLDTDFEIC